MQKRTLMNETLFFGEKIEEKVLNSCNSAFGNALIGAYRGQPLKG